MTDLPTDFDWVTGFLKSTAESVPELIGITPSTETLNWRQDNPVSGVVSELAGMAVPYAGWFGAVMKAPKAAKAIKSIGDMVNKPVGTAVKRELAIFAPFEAGRVGLSQAFGDNPLSEEVSSSIVNLALGSGVTGLVAGVASAGLRKANNAAIFPGLEVAAPLPLQARRMKEALDGGLVRPDLMPRANFVYNETVRDLRREELTKAYKYVSATGGDPKANPSLKNMDQNLNRWFRPTEMPEGKSLQVRAFTNAADKNFPTAEAWKGEADFLGIHKDDWSKGQYFRSLSFNAAKPGNLPKVVDNQITKGFQSVGENWFLTREADDGMFVMAKKYIGTPGKADPTDKWLLLKTDQPGHFLPDNQRWADAMIATHRWYPEQTVIKDGGLVFNDLQNFMTKEVPFKNYSPILSNPRLVQQAIDKLGPVGSNEAVMRMKEQLRGLLAPRNYQFTKNARANYASMASKLAYDQAEYYVQQLVNGIAKIDPGQQVLSGHISSARGPLGTEPLRPTMMGLSEEEWGKVFEDYIRKGVALPDAELAYKAGEINDKQINLLRTFQAVDDITTTNVTNAEEAVGKRATQWKAGHYGWSHIWEGDTRIPIVNELGQEVFLAAGPNRRAAVKMAEEVLRDNPGWKQGNEYSKSQLIDRMLRNREMGDAADIIDNTKAVVMAPSWILERSGMGGYKWHNKTPTRDEFMTDYEAGLRSRWKYQANLALDDQMKPQLDRLRRENPELFKQVIQRMNADAGVQSDWGRKINQATDALLAPMIGNESATKIVSFTNTMMMNFHLGAMNLSYPAMSLATFVQTTLPEVAMVLGAMPERLAPYYSIFMAGGERGPAGGMAVLHPLKIAGQALKAMWKPSDDVAEALSWGHNNRTLDPRLIEEYPGAATAKFKDIATVGKSVLGGTGIPKDFSFTSWLRAFSEWLPANSERLSRTHSFTMGYIVARDLLRKNGKVLTKQEMFNFAKQFTEKTMYLYSAADRPRVLTNPVGAGFGLFKNWMFNYMASMGQYGNEAFFKKNFAPLAWQTAGTFALGGLSATPAYWAADIFSKAFTGNDALATAYDMFGNEDGWFNPADGIMYGFPAMLSGVSFYSQVQAPGANPSRDAVSLFNSVIWDRMAASSAAFGGAISHWKATGEHPGHDANVRLAMGKAFMPTTIYRIMSTSTDGEILSGTTGYPMVKDLSLYEQTLYRLKLNPVDVDKALAVSNKLYKQRESRKKAVASLGEAFANAQIKGDSAEMALIARQAIVWGIDTSHVMKSAMIRVDKQQQDMITRGYDPVDISTYYPVLEDD